MAAADHGCPRQSTMTIQLRSFQSTRPQTTPCEQQPRRRSLQSDAVLVRARLCDVPHPLYRLIVALLEHLKEAHVQARGGKHGNLEIHRDWRPAPRLVVHAGDHLDLATQRVLRVTWEAAKSPHDRRLIRLILGLTCGRVYVHLRSILGQWDLDEHARREELEGEHGLHLDVHLDARPAELLHHRQHPERQVDRVCDAISHQLELAVGWHKAHRSILVELTQLDALMERAVVDFNPRSRAPRLVAAVPSLVVEEELVVQPKLALGHPGEVALDLYVPGHVVAQHSALVRHHQVALLNNIDEELILAVLDPLFPPADGTGCLDGDVLRRCRVLLAHRLLALLRDVHLEQVDRRVLRVAVVEHLIEQLVDQYEVVADGVVVHLWAAVRLDDVHE
mmetsp:Transcript_4183/g.10782  ORF Transcript_4183/g.10782 Transcript_4183/m.10782 type:complete len:392 (+) Transcript_4183:77-1252(+)